ELRGKGLDFEVCKEARDGFQKACECAWDCIICSPELSDIDGLWVARRIRTEPGRISKVPMVFFGPAHDGTLRTATPSPHAPSPRVPPGAREGRRSGRRTQSHRPHRSSRSTSPAPR